MRLEYEPEFFLGRFSPRKPSNMCQFQFPEIWPSFRFCSSTNLEGDTNRPAPEGSRHRLVSSSPFASLDSRSAARFYSETPWQVKALESWNIALSYWQSQGFLPLSDNESKYAGIWPYLQSYKHKCAFAFGKCWSRFLRQLVDFLGHFTSKSILFPLTLASIGLCKCFKRKLAHTIPVPVMHQKIHPLWMSFCAFCCTIKYQINPWTSGLKVQSKCFSEQLL